MKRILICAALVMAATPLQAQTAGRMAVREARPVAAGPVVAVPRPVRPDRPDRPDRPERPDRPDRQAAAEHLRHIYARAQNAVENGASPERVRAAVQNHTQQLRRRWNAANGG
jgi:hypothetical protein